MIETAYPYDMDASKIVQQWWLDSKEARFQDYQIPVREEHFRNRPPTQGSPTLFTRLARFRSEIIELPEIGKRPEKIPKNAHPSSRDKIDCLKEALETRLVKMLALDAYCLKQARV